MSASSCVWIGSFFSVWPMIDPTSSRSGKKISMRSTFFSCAIEMTRGSSGSFASRMTSPVDGSTTSDEAVGHGPVDLPVLDVQLVDVVEGPDDLVGAAQAEGAEEDRRQELSLPVDAHVEQVLGVVLELHPRAAVRDDLRDVERLVFRVEEGARRTVQLRDDDALGAVDDERAVVRHQRDVAEVDLLLLDVADGLDAGLGILVPDDETDRDLQRHRVGHAALLALVHVVLQLHPDRMAADVADVAARMVRDAAARAEHFMIAV